MIHPKSTLSKRFSTISHWIENLSEARFAYLMMLPVLAIFSVIALWPLIFTFETSLYADDFSQFRGAFVGLTNYANVLTGDSDTVLIRPFLDLENPFQSILPVTLIFAVVSVLLIGALGLVQALVLNKDFRGRALVRTAVLLPWAVPIIIQGMIFYILFTADVGLGTRVLNELGLTGTRPLGDSASALGIIIIADVWKQAAFVALIVLAGLQSIDQQLYDVAKVAGASRWQQFRMITLPQVSSILLVALLLTTITAMRVYGQIEAIAGCSTVPSLTCGVVGTFNASRYPTSATVAFITAGLIGVITLIYIVLYRDTGGV